MNEIWKDLQGYEGYYQISNYGNVKSLSRIVPRKISTKNPKGTPIRVKERLLKFGLGELGHCSVTLWKEHKREILLVHILVARYFIGEPPVGCYVCHKDGNPQNNQVNNLYLGTPKENSFDKRIHGTHLCGEDLSWSTLTEENIREIRKLSDTTSQTVIGQMFSITQSTVSRIVNRKLWEHVV